MQGIDYWIGTFLSRPDEVFTVALAVAVFGGAALGYSDRRDKAAVATVIVASATQTTLPVAAHNQ